VLGDRNTFVTAILDESRQPVDPCGTITLQARKLAIHYTMVSATAGTPSKNCWRVG